MKVAYIDVETTGLDAAMSGIIQIACLIVEKGRIIDEIDLFINPLSYMKDCVIDPKALEINGRTNDEIATFHDSDEQLEKFLQFLQKHISAKHKLQIFWL